MQTAGQARVDCSVGQTAHAGARIDQLKKAISLVSELIAATRLADGPSPPSDNPSPPHAPAARASPPNLSNPGTGPPFVPLLLGDSMSQDGMNPADFETRKRCASSMTEDDRVPKALKMEPLDDVSQSPLSSFPFSVGPGPAHSVPFPSNPPSSPPSRPESSTGVPLHSQLNMYQRPMTSSIFPPSLNVAAANGRAPSDFSSPTSASHQPVSGHVASFGQSPEAWGEHPGTFAPSHRHSLSCGSRLNGDVEMKNLIMGGPPAFASPAAGFHSLPAAPLPTPPAATVAPALLQSAPRGSRSNSLSNPPSGDPFAFGVPFSEATIDERAEYRVDMSRPDTGFSRSHSPVSPSDDDDEPDSEPGSPSNSRYRARNGSIGEANHSFPRPLPRRVLVNRTSTDNFNSGMGTNGNGSSSHSNEVPQEYRAEVDRIFFEFLNKICSNRPYTLHPMWYAH